MLPMAIQQILMTITLAGESALQCVAVCCRVLQCVAECVGLLQCVQFVGVCCSVLFLATQQILVTVTLLGQSVLQCAALCCSVLQCVAVRYLGRLSRLSGLLPSQVRVHRSVLQCLVVCCSLLILAT
jgi:hypothetical protein